MERVAFLIEATGERISCLLNPEFLQLTRQSGVTTRKSVGGAMTGAGRTDDPVIATGGGVTEVELKLLFDVQIAQEGKPPADDGEEDPEPMDVRALTKPLWNLSENAPDSKGFGAPPTVRLIWGKSWNIPGVIVSVAEKLDRFDGDGVPQRSWLVLRLRRVGVAKAQAAPKPSTPPQFQTPSVSSPGGDDTSSHEILALPDGSSPERLDLIASDQYGDPGLVRALAEYNGLDDYLRPPPGSRLVLPPAAGVEA
jgi:hypothetical protein